MGYVPSRVLFSRAVIGRNRIPKVQMNDGVVILNYLHGQNIK